MIVDLEDWEAAWAPPVPLGRLYVSFPMDDGDEVDPKVRELAVFIASLVTSGRRVLVHCTEGLNRSGVVVARALMAMGLTASDAIDLVRRQEDQASTDSSRLAMTPSLIGCIEKATRPRPEPHR